MKKTKLDRTPSETKTKESERIGNNLNQLREHRLSKKIEDPENKDGFIRRTVGGGTDRPANEAMGFIRCRFNVFLYDLEFSICWQLIDVRR